MTLNHTKIYSAGIIVIASSGARLLLLPIWDFLMRAVRAIFLAVWSIWLFSQPAFAEKRVALVIGNSAYKNVRSAAESG